MIKRILILAGCLCMAGCVPHFKDMDSYNIMFRDADEKPHGTGDPYTFGGIAEGSGGLIARQSHATDDKAPDPRDDTPVGKMGEIDKDRTPTADGMVMLGSVGSPGDAEAVDRLIPSGTPF